MQRSQIDNILESGPIGKRILLTNRLVDDLTLNYIVAATINTGVLPFHVLTSKRSDTNINFQEIRVNEFNFN